MTATTTPNPSILSRSSAPVYGPTVTSRLRDRLHGEHMDQGGFGTLDVLLGMAITVLILVIGGINIGKIRERGMVDEAGQEAIRMSQALESWVTDNYEAPPMADGGTPTNPANHYPNWGTGATRSNMTGLGVGLESDTSIRFYRQLTPTVDGAYTFCAVIARNGKQAYAYYDSRQDKVLGSGILSALPTATQCAP